MLHVYPILTSSFVLQVSSRLAELQATLEAGAHHRDNVLTTIGFNLEKWTVLVGLLSGH